jgi:hypothetical protein
MLKDEIGKNSIWLKKTKWAQVNQENTWHKSCMSLDLINISISEIIFSFNYIIIKRMLFSLYETTYFLKVKKYNKHVGPG